MKIYITLLLVTFCSMKGFSQLTLQETIKYLNTRLAETKSLSIHYNSERLYTMSNTSVTERNDYQGKIAFSYTRTFADGAVDHLEHIFDPTHITGFNTVSTTYDDAVGMMPVQLAGLTLIIKQTTNGKVRNLDSDKFVFPFLRTDRLNAERIQKALLHLKKLCQDAKPLDPFLN